MKTIDITPNIKKIFIIENGDSQCAVDSIREYIRLNFKEVKETSSIRIILPENSFLAQLPQDLCIYVR